VAYHRWWAVLATGEPTRSVSGTMRVVRKLGVTVILAGLVALTLAGADRQSLAPVSAKRPTS
jgi:hypothetical protein